MDVTQHGEEAYADGEGAILVLPDGATSDRRDRHGDGRRPRMKLVVAIVRPEQRRSASSRRCYKAEVQGLTISRVQGHGGEREHVETYRGTTVKMELSEKVRLEIGVSDHFVEPTVRRHPRGARAPATSATARSSCCRSRRSIASGRAKRTRRPSRP